MVIVAAITTVTRVIMETNGSVMATVIAVAMVTVLVQAMENTHIFGI